MKDATLTIDIFHGTASDWFKNFPIKSVDHWFLDGFSPARNPEMWTEELFSSMADFSMNGSTLATFTSAGFVRRGLGQVGFSMNRTKGYGKKREMLVGSFGDAPAESSVTTT
jgi:tRNA 5-methylaminomethyl-2-thiouridine biosynthesis bifunctional protein